MAKIVNRLQDFMKLESAAGIILMFAAVLALISNNSPLSYFYAQLLSTPMEIQIGALEIAKPLILWINDGLMAIFFFLVGLEIKREVMEGELSSFDKAVLPMLAAVGGMLGPALMYAFINWGEPETLRGWAIPAATDIAFALGILTLLGNRVPVSLKVFLLAVAIIDDLGAIVIIALFYTENLSTSALGIGLVGIVALVALNRSGVKKIVPYTLIGVFVWVCVLKSGVHATLAGVITAFAIPLAGKTKEDPSPLHHLEHALHPWVAYMVLPIFAFANAGVSLAGIRAEDLLAPVPLGIAMGLIVGKQVGVFGFTFAAVKLGIAKLPTGTNWREIYALACLTGVGFTMSLFIGTLAFDDAETINQVRLGVLMGSLVSGVLGYVLLRQSCPKGHGTKVDAKTLDEEAHGDAESVFIERT
ncbi:MAG: Na+/H+ antiporter NhaA [Pseudomonadota bacterium]